MNKQRENLYAQLQTTISRLINDAKPDEKAELENALTTVGAAELKRIESDECRSNLVEFPYAGLDKTTN